MPSSTSYYPAASTLTVLPTSPSSAVSPSPYHTLSSPLTSSSSTSAPSASYSAVQVAVRIRPINARQANGNPSATVCHVDARAPQTVVIDPPSSRSGRRTLYPERPEQQQQQQASQGEERQFGFDFVYDDNDGSSSPSHAVSHYQQRVYHDIGAQIVANAVAGYNCSLLAYGQTSSGKSYSMMGSADEEGRGLIPRICAALFDLIAAAPPPSASGDSVVRKLECSYIEIYSEKIRDLLDPRKKNLKVRESPKTGPYIEGVSVCAVSDYAELAALMASGNAERTIASTNMNAESSRSHAVFTLQLTTTTIDDASQLSSDVVSKVQLVDLAGSERVDTSGATGLRLKEASQINKSLTTLGRVVQALAKRSEEQGRSGASSAYPTMGGRKSVSAPRKGADEVFIPFRDSVLTWLLKESLGGNSKTFMLATVSPSELNVDETLSTLRYASRAKNIVNKATINEDPNAELIRSLKAEVEALRARLAQSEATSPTLLSPSHSASSAGSVRAFESLREKDAELLKMNAHIARLQSELAQNSVSIVEMEAHWQGKLRQARELEEARLREMVERGVSVVTVKELPFLVNLNEDPALTESLIYHLQEGTTTVGSRKRSRPAPSTSAQAGTPKSASSAETSDDEDGAGGADDPLRRVVLTGLHVREDHCTLTTHPNGVIIAPIPGVPAETHVNGELLTEERALVHGDRVVVGQQHFFRFSRSKLAIEEDRSKSEEARRKRKEERKARMSIITTSSAASPTSPTSMLSPQQSPLTADVPEPSPYDFEYAQRELIVGGTKKAGKPSAGGRAQLNRSMNRSHVEHTEPDSSPEASQAVRGSALSLPVVGEGGAMFQIVSPLSPVKSPSSAPLSARSPSSLSNPPESPSPSCVKVTHTEEKESEAAEQSQLQAPTFHLGRDIKGSVDWSSRRALTRGEIDEWIRQDRRYLAREKQRLVERAHASCAALMQPLSHLSVAEYKVASHAVYRWRWHVIKRALQEEIMRVVFLCDEANAIASALGRPERYKVELASSHNVLPEIFLSALPFTTVFSQPQGSPLQRLRQLKVVFCQVVEVRRRMLPVPVLSFDLVAFQDQLAALRDLYNDMLDGSGEPASRATTATSLTSSYTLSSQPAPLPALPSAELYAHPQLLGRALCFLHALRYGHSIKHSATVLDERGEVAGVLGVEMEIASVDEDVARREISQEEKQRVRDEREEDARRALVDAVDPSVDGEDGASASSSGPPTPPLDEEQKSDSFLQAHRTLAVIVRLTHYDTQTRNLRRAGLQSVWVKYHVKDSTVAYRSRKATVVDDGSRLALDYCHTHYFSGMELQMLMEWLLHDAVVFELWCRVEEPNRTAQEQRKQPRHSMSSAIPRSSTIGSSSSTSASALLSPEDDADHEASSAGRRESLAKRMQSPLNRSASKDRKETPEKSMATRASTLTPHHVRRTTVGGSMGSALGLLGGGVGGSGAKVEIDNGNVLVDHLLFACVDVEEEVAGKKGTFAPCSLKREEDGSIIHRVTMARERRLVVTLMQADHRPFVLESLRKVTATALTLKTAGARPSAALATPHTFTVVEQFAKVDAKLLICTCAWSRALDEHSFFAQPSAAGERVNVQVALECFFSETTVPVHVPVSLEVKLYRDAERGGGLFRGGKGAGTLTNESERFARLGCHVSVTRQSSPQTVGNVLREHELQLEQLQRRIRFEHRSQHERLLTKLQHTTPQAVQEARDLYERGADGLARHFTLRFSRILADLHARGGIRVDVQRVAEESGIKCGYLNERRAGARSADWEPKWCVLRTPYLFIYAKRGERREQSIVKLLKAEYSRGGGAVNDWSFQIKTSSGPVFLLQAANEAEMRSWIKALGANLD